VLRFSRPPLPPAFGRDLADNSQVSLTVRVDIEDRNFHTETEHNPGVDHHFRTHTHALADGSGFAFTPARDRQLQVKCHGGAYHEGPEWCHGVWHPLESTRGLRDRADVFSPGWFDLPLDKESTAMLVLTAEAGLPDPDSLLTFESARVRPDEAAIERAGIEPSDSFGRQLAIAIQAFVARREKGKTVIAGYPWFLDWGRDTLICARGLLAAGMTEEVLDILATYGGYVEGGTLPNQILGENASNRDTSDAPLWFGIACEELAALMGRDVYARRTHRDGRTLLEVLRAIACGYQAGTPNGIRLDVESGLIWSPFHFTWMDTNYPASTPREGYPVEIQVLWVRLLRQLARVDPESRVVWENLADRATASLQRLFWLEGQGYWSDLLIAKAGTPAAQAVIDNALRSNFLFGIALGVLNGERAKEAVRAAASHLVVPGALRTLAPLPVDPPLAVHHPQTGQLLNDPAEPYWGRYEGDEDTRRKPAYHNGTAWVWTFPTFCEALARAWDFSPEAVAAARSYLGSLDILMAEGCAGQLPEILDGDAPHQQRGCDAQAWSATEALRVWKLLRGGG
jgi:predicted glycogen debranching enzyme